MMCAEPRAGERGDVKVEVGLSRRGAEGDVGRCGRRTAGCGRVVRLGVAAGVRVVVVQDHGRHELDGGLGTQFRRRAWCRQAMECNYTFPHRGLLLDRKRTRALPSRKKRQLLLENLILKLLELLELGELVLLLEQEAWVIRRVLLVDEVAYAANEVHVPVQIHWRVWV